MFICGILFVLPSSSVCARLHPIQNQTDGLTPLMRAVEQGQVNTVRSLLRNGVEVDAKHPAGFTALMLAVRKGDLSIVKLLLNARANPNVSVMTPHAGEVSPLIWAIMSGNQLMV